MYIVLTISLLEYSIGRFSSSTDSEATVAAPSSVRLESTFCRNFTCCGRGLDDLHDLLQHYEECHVRFEDEDEDVPSMMTDEELEETASIASESSAPAAPSGPVSPVTSPGSSKASGADSDLKRDRSLNNGPSTPMVVTSAENLDSPSAFDTAVMRSPSTNRGKKRAFGQPNMGGGSGANPLYRALIDGGNRHPFGMPNVYSPASPFSTPGSSRAGTPTLDSDSETFFGSTTQPSVFSNLSIRGNNTEDHQLPSCAPPNLFFPSATANQAARPAKRERFNSNGSNGSAPSAGSSAANVSATASPMPTDSNASEHRPYKCPAPGCDKAYKQMNGLKYHRLHGHCNQNLRNVNNGLVLPSEGAQNSAQNTPTPNGDANSAGAGATDHKPAAGQTPDLAAFGIHSTGTNASETQPREAPSTPTKPAATSQPEKTYVCQVGNCDKRYKNLNGLRYHYLHSGSHGLLGLQLLHANGGGASAKADSISGRPPVSTETLSREQIVQAAAAAQALLNQQAQAQCAKNAPNAGTLPSSAAFLAAVSNGNMSLTGGNAP